MAFEDPVLQPTRAALALNRLAREHGEDLERYVFDRDDDRLPGLLTALDVHHDLIARVLEAARTDPRLAAAVVAGRLTWVPEPPPDPAEQLVRAEAGDRDARERVAQARVDVNDARQALREAERRLHDAERAAHRAREERRRAQR